MTVQAKHGKCGWSTLSTGALVIGFGCENLVGMPDAEHEGEVDYSKDGQWREVAPGVMVRVPAHVELTVDDYRVAFELALFSEGLRPQSISVTAKNGAKPVDGAVLRGLRIAELTREAIESVVLPMAADGETIEMLPVALVESKFTKRPDDRSLLRLSQVFKLAQLLGVPPAKYVQEKFELPRSTAGYWIKLAREKGYLEKPSGRTDNDG